MDWLNQLLTVRTNDPELTRRGRALQATLLLICLAALVVQLLSLLQGIIITGSLVMLVAAPVIFGIARAGYVQHASALLAFSVLGLLILGPAQREIVQSSDAISLSIPIVIAGLLLGSQAVLLMGAITLIAVGVLIALQGVPLDPRVFILVMALTTLVALLWTLIRQMERALGRARERAEAATAAERQAVEREQELSRNYSELQSANERSEQLLGLVRELETPVIPILQGVLVAPLVGHLDQQRLERIGEGVMRELHAQRATTLLLDITGIKTIDESAIAGLRQLINAIRLLGSYVILTGISAELAREMVGRNIELKGVRTAASLQDGIALVLAGRTQAPRKQSIGE